MKLPPQHPLPKGAPFRTCTVVRDLRPLRCCMRTWTAKLSALEALDFFSGTGPAAASSANGSAAAGSTGEGGEG